MKNVTVQNRSLQSRADSYNSAFAKYPGSHLVTVNGMLSGVWLLGILRSQNHRVRFVFIMQKPIKEKENDKFC